MNSRKVVQRAALVLASTAAAAAWGHANHAEPGASTTLLHLLTEPDHVLALVAAIGAVGWALRRLAGRSRQRRD